MGVRGRRRRVGGGAGRGRDQEYSKRENAARPACRDSTYLTRNLYSRPAINTSNTTLTHGYKVAITIMRVRGYRSEHRGQ